MRSIGRSGPDSGPDSGPEYQLSLDQLQEGPIGIMSDNIDDKLSHNGERIVRALKESGTHSRLMATAWSVSWFRKGRYDRSGEPFYCVVNITMWGVPVVCVAQCDADGKIVTQDVDCDSQVDYGQEPWVTVIRPPDFYQFSNKRLSDITVVDPTPRSFLEAIGEVKRLSGLPSK